MRDNKNATSLKATQLSMIGIIIKKVIEVKNALDRANFEF